MTERSVINRIFNDTETTVDIEDDLDGEIDSRHVDYSIFSKLLNAANGTVVLTPTDVDQVIAIICKTMNSGGNLAPREETTAAIVDLLGTTAESCDEALLKYLTTNYTRLEHQSAEQESESSMSVSSVPSNKRLTLESMQPISSELGFLLEGLAEWTFDIFAVKACTKSCLRVVTMTCMTELNLLDYTDFDGVKLESYLTEIDKAYHDNPYHNSIHAADVVQTTYHFCTKGRLIDASGLTPLATFALLFAGAIHDVNHGGLTNHFLVATSASLAIQYNDHSPLENMHVATAFNIMHTPAFNFMEQLPASTKKEIRRLVIAIVLATDNDQHFSLHEGLESIANCREPSMSPISQLISRTKRLSSGTPNSTMTSNITPICCSPEDKDSNGKLGSISRPHGVRLNLRSRGSISPPPQAGSLFNTARISQDMFRSVSRVKSANLRRNSVDSAPSRKNSAIYPNSRNGSQSNSFTENSISVLSDKHQLLLLESVLHIADVSNPAKPWKLYSRWLDGVMAEFYNQGDRERELSLPITFAFDRHNPVPQSKFQLGFIKAIVLPLFKTFSKLNGIEVTHCIRQLDKNSNRWLESPLTEEDTVLKEAANTLDNLDSPMKLNRSEERSI